MRDSFIFYRSFALALEGLPDVDKLALIDAIIKKSLDDEDVPLSGIQSNLFVLIKPILEANSKRFEDGCKGGRPKRKTGGFKNKKPNKDKDVNKDYNKDVDSNYKEKTDPFNNRVKNNFENEYKKVFKKKPFLSRESCENLISLSSSVKDFNETLNETLLKLQKLNFDDIGFKPDCGWFLKEKNYAAIRNGVYDGKISTQEQNNRREEAVMQAIMGD